MSNKLVEENLYKVQKESTYTWTLYYAKTRTEIDEVKYPYRQTFREMENKWKGQLIINYVDGHYRIRLLLNAEETINIKYKLLALDRSNNVRDEKEGEITIYEKLKSEVFKCCCTLHFPGSIFSSVNNFIMIKLNILEKLLEIRKAFCESNECNRILEKLCGTKKPYEINVNETLKNDFKMMFENEKFSDFIIKLNDSHEIPVHRNILAARSPVFSAMFENDSLEKKEGYVKITDIDKDTLMLLLNFIYTGNLTSDLSDEKAAKLLSAADKYDILDLKRICGKCLESNLEISNAIDTLLLSELHVVPELKNCVFKFIVENKESFLDPLQFEKVYKQFPNLMAELVTEIFVNKM